MNNIYTSSKKQRFPTSRGGDYYDPVTPKSTSTGNPQRPSLTSQNTSRDESPSTSERIWDTITGSTKQALGNLGSGVSTYLQNSQSNLLREDEIKYDLKSKRYAQMLSDNQTTPGTWNEDFLKAKERELNDTKRMLDVGKQAVANSSLVQGANALRDSSAALTRSGAQNIARAKENPGTLGRFAVDVGAAGTQLVGDAFLAGLTGGMGVLPVKAVQAFGSGAEQARAAGANLDQQAAYGLANAALNLGTEKLFNLATPLKKTYGAGLLESPLADTLNSFRETAPIQMGLSALTEGGEEFVEALAQPLLQKAIYDPDAEFDLNDAFYQGFVGGTVGGLAGGADAISELDLSDGFLSGFFAPEIAELQNSSNQYISDDTVPSASIESSSQKDYTEFDKYTSVLQELAPSSLDEFLDIKNDPEKWSDLQEKYQILDMYKVDTGTVSKTDILNLHQTALREKRDNFKKPFTKSGNFAAAYLNGDNHTMYYAHSGLSNTTGGYKGNSQLVLLKEHPRFSYVDVHYSDGTIRQNTWHDTEAKLFEQFADMYEQEPFKSITMISERGMCDSCKSIMEQFQAQFPDVKINIISNKKSTGNVWRGL